MAYLPPSVLSSLRKALAWLPFLWKKLAARNVLQRFQSFILRSLQFHVGLPCLPKVSTGENQRTHSDRGTTTELTAVITAENPPSQLQTSIHALLDPLPTDNREDSSTRLRGPVSQAQRVEPLQLLSHPPRARPLRLIRPSRLDLLAFAKPVVPGQLQRYDMTRMCVGTILHTGSNSNIDKLAIAIRNETYYTQDFIQPCKLDYEEPQVGWSRIIHPEGAPYYSAKFGNMFVYTDTELRVPEYLGYVRDFIDALLNASGRLPHGSRALVLELKFEDGPDRRKPLCFYYFVDHEKRLIFWVHQVTIRNVCGNVRGVKSEGHLRYAIHTHYWHHCERYPSNFPYAQELYTHLQRILIVANADSMLSDTPLGPFESTDLQRLLNLMPMVKGQMDSDTDSDPAVTVLARVMRLFCQYRFLNSYGQVGARLGGGRSVFSRRKVNEEPVSWFFQCVDIALLRAPISHLRGIQTIWVDEMIDESRWKTYISSLNTEWNGFTIYSTVMLAVDVSFLAVPGVQAASGDPQSGATIAIYASVISSVCALIISVILAGQIRTHDVDSVGGGADYMVRMTRKAHGIKVLAVMFSLPYSLLLWAMLSFVVALGLVVFDTSDTLTLATMIPVWGVVILLALLPLWWKRLPSFAFAVAHPRRRLQQRHP